MSSLHDALPRDRYLPLPGDNGQRRCGVEVEFAGLDVARSAKIVRSLWGGDSVAQSAREVHVTGGRFGKVKVEIDLTLSKKWAEQMATQMLGDLVPVEIVTAPLAQLDLPQVDRLADALHAAGAMGTSARLAFGFGVHLNPELPEDDGRTLLQVARAYGLMEDWLRAGEPLDPARRILPFVDPWPRRLIEALVDARDWAPADLGRAYAALAPSRNYGLDLLPALQHLCPEVLSDIPEGQLKGARPSFHYRLPESRLGEAGWSIAYEWNRWCVIEHVATDGPLLETLAARWSEAGGRLRRLRGDWASEIERTLGHADLGTRLGLGAGPSS